MILAVVTCHAYRDAWEPFFRLLDKFWPNRPQAWMLTDEPTRSPAPNVGVFAWSGINRRSWCNRIVNFAEEINEPVLLMQEDFFLHAPVNEFLIQHALEQMRIHNAGCVRLYPCPGGDIHYGDDYFAIVPRGTAYRISCQAAIWKPDYLRRITINFHTPHEFELLGSTYSAVEPEPILAFKREVQPWPIEYECTAIVRGNWTKSAVELMKRNGITPDLSMRTIEA